MNIPPAGIIESAVDQIKLAPKGTIIKLCKEFDAAVPQSNDDMRQGYLIGLATAQIEVLEGNLTQESIMNDLRQAESEPVAAEVIEHPTQEQLTTQPAETPKETE